MTGIGYKSAEVDGLTVFYREAGAADGYGLDNYYLARPGAAFFIPPGAEAFKRDIPDADVRFLPTGHFALETHAEEIANAIIDFLGP